MKEAGRVATLIVARLGSPLPVNLGERNVGHPTPHAFHAVFRPQCRPNSGRVGRCRREHRCPENICKNLQYLATAARGSDREQRGASQGAKHEEGVQCSRKKQRTFPFRENTSRKMNATCFAANKRTRGWILGNTAKPTVAAHHRRHARLLSLKAEPHGPRGAKTKRGTTNIKHETKPC